MRTLMRVFLSISAIISLLAGLLTMIVAFKAPFTHNYSCIATFVGALLLLTTGFFTVLAVETFDESIRSKEFPLCQK